MLNQVQHDEQGKDAESGSALANNGKDAESSSA
jgi:hypothetical protein